MRRDSRIWKKSIGSRTGEELVREELCRQVDYQSHAGMAGREASPHHSKQLQREHREPDGPRYIQQQSWSGNIFFFSIDIPLTWFSAVHRTSNYCLGTQSLRCVLHAFCTERLRTSSDSSIIMQRTARRRSDQRTAWRKAGYTSLHHKSVSAVGSIHRTGRYIVLFRQIWIALRFVLCAFIDGMLPFVKPLWLVLVRRAMRSRKSMDFKRSDRRCSIIILQSC